MDRDEMKGEGGGQQRREKVGCLHGNTDFLHDVEEEARVCTHAGAALVPITAK